MRTIPFAKVLGCLAVISACICVQAADRHWRGTSSALASAGSNWYEGTAPVDGDAVILDADSANKPMTWDLDDVTLASWSQSSDYTGTVTFQTGISRSANKVATTAHGVLAADGVTRVLKVTGNVNIQGGTWTHTVNPTMAATDEAWTDGKGIYRLIAEIGGDYTLGAAAKTDVTAMGYRANQGPGYAPNNGVGGSHGGLGSRISVGYSHLNSAAGNNCYGLVKAPTTLGSGATGNPTGGGGIVISAGGTATVSGSLLADASTTASGSQWGSGAGGTIYIKAGAIAQSGKVSANGGFAGNCSTGGGGRIALVSTNAATDSLSVDRTVITAYGGKCGASFASGYCGTIYLESAADKGRGELIVKGGNYSNQDHGYGYGAQMWDPAATDDYDFSKVTLLNAGDLVVGTGVTMKVDAIVSNGDTTKKYLNVAGGTLKCTGSEMTFPYVVFRGCRKNAIQAGVHSLTGRVVVADGAGTFKLDSTSTYVVDGAFAISGDVQVVSGSTLTHTSHDTMNGSGKYAITSITNRMDLWVSGDMTVDAGGAVAANEIGFTSRTGPGMPLISGRAGASHGGEGFVENVSEWATAQHAPCYGSVRHPTMYGSGGDSHAGGGAIKISVDGTLTVNGAITATGGQKAASDESGSRSAAGGSVWVIAGELAGSGEISANGGYTYHYRDGSSGGGRVAVTLTEPSATFAAFRAAGGKITAYGGKCQGKDTKSGAGTVYLRTGAQGDREGTLVIDNNGTTHQIYGRTIFGQLVTDTEVGSVIITNCAAVVLSEAANVEFSGDWTVMANSILSNAVGSTVTAVGTGTSTLSGTNYFYNFTCTAPGKTLMFDTSASCFGLLTLGTLTLAGESESPIALRSVTDDTAWPMNFVSGAIADINYADIRDSANAGANVVANKSVDSGNNTGWKIFKEIRPGTNTWTGAAENSEWDNASNWSQERAPIADDEVVIDAGYHGCNPVLSSDSVQLKSLTVTENGFLTLSATLTVTSSVEVAGWLEGTGTLALNGATANLNNGRINIGTLLVNGDAEVTLDLANDTIGNVIMARTGGAVTFPAGVTSSCFTASGPSTLSFGAGTTLKAREVRIDGLVGEEKAIRLMGVGDTTWKLEAAGLMRANGVRVSGSQAIGLAVFATSSEPVDGAAANDRWPFSGTQRTWTGAAGTADFHDAANWGGTLPGAEDTVIVPDGADILATNAVSIGSLYVEGGALRFSNTVAVANAVEVENGATLVLDATATVGGAFNLRSGATLTHTKNGATALYRIDLTVGGDLTVESGASIDLMGKGFAAHQGPGKSTGGVGGGASHGGYGCDAGGNVSAPCYGSIRHPVTLGSGSESAGGGAAKFTVAGTFRMDGTLNAEGTPSWTAGTYRDQYVGAGGSCWVTCGTLTGAGEFNVNGARALGIFGGSGGRFALWQTVATTTNAFTGKMTAYGTMYDAGYGTASSIPCASCGTVFIHNANDPDDGGTLILDDKGGSNTEKESYNPSHQPTGADFPGEDGAAAFRHVTVIVQRGGSLKLTESTRIEVLEVHKVATVRDSGVNTQLRLDGHELKIYGRPFRKGRGWWQPKSGTEVDPYEVVTTPGVLFWYAPFMLMLR